MTRTIGISGTDWTGNDAHWIRRPHHSLHRNNVEDWADMFTQIAGKGRIDAVAMGIRGSWDVDSVLSLPIAMKAYAKATPQPALMPWYDTGGLPSCIDKIPFDFANDAHIAAGWQEYARIFFDHFKSAKLERTAGGRILCAWWGINSSVGQLNSVEGFTNQHLCQRLLDLVDAEISKLGLGGTAHILDVTWAQHAPSVKAFGLHDWFNPWSTPTQSYTVKPHNGVTVAVTVPSFWNNNIPAPGGDLIPPDGGQVLARGLSAARDAHADYVMIEGVTDGSEGAMVIAHKNADGSANEDNLNALRRHMELTTGAPMPEPEPPIVPPVEPVLVPPSGPNLIALEEVTDHVLHEALIPGKTQGTYALIVGVEAGGRKRIGSLKDNGEWSWRYLDDPVMKMPAEWESARKLGRMLVYRTGPHVKMFWIAAEGI